MRNAILSSSLICFACADGTSGLTQGRLGHIGFGDGAGATQLHSRYDRELEVECYVRDDGRGVLRCLPHRSLGLLYGDADCTAVPLGVFVEADTTPYVWAHVDEVERYYAVGERHEGLVYRATVNGCEITGSPHVDGTGLTIGLARPGTRFGPKENRRLVEVEPERFARVTVERRTITDQLDRVLHIAEDGSRVFGHLEDRRWSRPCSLMPVEDAVYCGPGSFAFWAGYDNATCTGERLWTVHHYHGPTEHAWDVGRSCEPARLVELGESSDEVPIFQHTGLDRTCVETGRQSGVLRVREVDPAAQLPRLTYEEEGDGRLVARQPSAAGFGIVERFGTRFYDREGGFDCQPNELEGRVVCAPLSSGSIQPMFRDPACTVPVRVAWHTMDRVQHASGDDGVYHVTDETPTELYVNGPSGCRDALGQVPAGRTCGAWRVVGARDDTELAEMTYAEILPR